MESESETALSVCNESFATTPGVQVVDPKDRTKILTFQIFGQGLRGLAAGIHAENGYMCGECL